MRVDCSDLTRDLIPVPDLVRGDYPSAYDASVYHKNIGYFAEAFHEIPYEAASPGDSIDLYKWTIGEENAEPILSIPCDSRVSISNEDILIDPPGKHLFLLYENDNNKKNLCRIDLDSLEYGILFRDIPLADHHDSLNKCMVAARDGTRFAFIEKGCVCVMDTKGRTLCTIPIDTEKNDVSALSFTPGADTLLLLQSDQSLTAWDVGKGRQLQMIDLSETCPTFDPSSYDLSGTSWNYTEDGFLVLSNHDHTILIDRNAENWGVQSYIIGGQYYDPTKDRIYCIDESNGKAHLGYFRRYPMDELIQMGNEFIN